MTYIGNLKLTPYDPDGEVGIQSVGSEYAYLDQDDLKELIEFLKEQVRDV